MSVVTTGTVVSLEKAKERRPADDKWGKAVMDIGFSIIPSLIFRAQHRLGLNPTQLAVVLQLADFWWESGRKPYPSKAALAQRLGIKERQVQRYIAELEKAGLIRREERFLAGGGGQTSNLYHLDGLVKKLQELEPEFREVREDNKRKRAAVERRKQLKPVSKTLT
ncbi:hypothetical protein J2847_006466 [Azospirillum agricola]|uniref:helix-turn-helix domain-containing protein n=1 Tax=Azospirillum agricola TaxID=1720247 RepID=UPI001AE8595E|nr:helix-turn-helix domain-containing protein [Azospirillum agricola]MBP2233131.1 hypothetical protein [Azospirillum agricola]